MSKFVLPEVRRTLPDGRILVVMPLLWGMGRLGIGWPDDCAFEDVWDFPTTMAAAQAWETWDGTGEPVGWHKHPGSGRRRPHGKPPAAGEGGG